MWQELLSFQLFVSVLKDNLAVELLGFWERENSPFEALAYDKTNLPQQGFTCFTADGNILRMPAIRSRPSNPKTFVEQTEQSSAELPAQQEGRSNPCGITHVRVAEQRFFVDVVAIHLDGAVLASDQQVVDAVAGDVVVRQARDAAEVLAVGDFPLELRLAAARLCEGSVRWLLFRVLRSQ